MSSLIVTNVLSSSVEISYNYLNTEELFSYNVVGNYVINISDINVVKNDTTLLKGRDAISSVYNRQNITARIGADEYLNGRITSYNFEAGSLVGSENVNISIEESRRLDGYAGTQFAKFIPNPHALENFSESYDFSRSGPDYSSNRNISIQYKQEAGDQFLNNAKTFLTNYYFANRPNFGFQQDGISENATIDKDFRGIITETYDLINLSVSLSEKIDTSFINQTLNVGKKETVNLQIDDKGFLTKIFNIDLTALRLDSENILSKAISAIIDLKISEEEAEFGTPFSITKGISRDNTKANLSISFSTDPRKSQSDIIDYSGQKVKKGKFNEFTLSVEYNSNGKNILEKFKNSRQSWINENTTYIDKIQRLFHPTVPYFEKSRQTSFLKSDGKINESVVFTTDDSYNSTDDGLLKLKKTLTKNHQIKRIEKFLALETLEDQIVQSNLKTVGKATVRADAVVSQTAGINRAKEILESKTSSLNELVDENIIHITSDVFSVNLGEGSATRTINYLFLDA